MELFYDIREWLNTYIAPHQLISITLFETAHPNIEGGVNAVITHSAGEEPKPLDSNILRLYPRGIYRMHIITGDLDWKQRFTEAKDFINRNLVYDGHALTSANDSMKEEAIVLIFSWQMELANSTYY